MKGQISLEFIVISSVIVLGIAIFLPSMTQVLDKYKEFNSNEKKESSKNEIIEKSKILCILSPGSYFTLNSSYKLTQNINCEKLDEINNYEITQNNSKQLLLYREEITVFQKEQ